ncbi:MAG: hypothetical protein AAB225_03545 [Acidobacteriota bacterium]
MLVCVDRRRGPPLVTAVVLLVAGGCGRPQPRKTSPPKPPQTIVLWAWDRAEDLRFLKPGEAEVAALMETLYLRDGRAEPWFRRLPLVLPEGMKPIPVIRLESDGSALPPADSIGSFLWRWVDLKRIQIDFDARSSQREWYVELIRLTRRWKPHISITALASWCLDKPWFAGVPDEAVPMLFRMGPQRNAILDRLHKQGQFAEGCRDALGISTDERLPWRPEAKKIYVFHPHPWTREAFDEARARLR